MHSFQFASKEGDLFNKLFLALRKKYIIGNQTVAEENLVLHFTTNSGGL